VEQDDKGPRASATFQPLDGGPSQRIELDGFVREIAVSNDGREILVVMEQSLVRWRPREGARSDVKEAWTTGIQAAFYGPDDRVLALVRYDEVELRAADGLARLGSLYTLRSGGWVLLGADGAVDGSPDAPDAVLTRATGAADVLLLGGRAAWDRFQVPGAYRRILAGEPVVPLLPGRAPASRRP